MEADVKRFPRKSPFSSRSTTDLARDLRDDLAALEDTVKRGSQAIRRAVELKADSDRHRHTAKAYSA
jgi:hypothetical protein